MDFQLRPALPTDAALLGSICHDAFKTIADRHGFPPDFPNAEVAIGLIDQLLSRADVHSVVAEARGRPVGSNFLGEGDAVAGSGPMPGPACFGTLPTIHEPRNFRIILAKVICVCRISGTWTDRYVDK